MKKALKEKINKLVVDTRAVGLGERVLYQGNFITLYEENYLLPNGHLLTREKIIKNNNKPAVIVIAVTPENEFLLVVQNRVNNNVTVEFPSGYMEPGESVIEAASRELLEETGYYSDDLMVLDSFRSSLGVDPSVMNIVIAKKCINIDKQSLDPGEYINYALFTLDELKELIDNHYINGASNRLAYYELINNLDKTKIFTK